MFRPEILQPMGLPEDVQVIAWGLSLERYIRKIRVSVTFFFNHRKFADSFLVLLHKQTNNDFLRD